jgi:hypothetical protein
MSVATMPISAAASSALLTLFVLAGLVGVVDTVFLFLKM